MHKLKYILIFLIFFSLVKQTEALDIQYGSIMGYKNNDVLIQYYGIGKKLNYICNLNNFKCSSTKKTILGKTETTFFKTSIKKELKNKGGNHAIISKTGKWLAYFIPANDINITRTYVIKNIKKNRNYTMNGIVKYWDLLNEEKKIFEFSPDEKTLFYTDDSNDCTSLYKINLNSLKENTFEGTRVEINVFNISTFMFYDSSNIYFVANTKDNPYVWSLYYKDLKTGKEKIIETNVSYTDKITKIGTKLIFNRLQEKGYGPEIYNVKTKKIDYFKIPNINTKKNIINEEYVKVGDSTGVIMTPLSYDPKKTYPVLIWLHGGPLRQTSLGYHPYHSYGIYDATLRLLQKNNVIILKLDYRGSYGQGRAYSEKIKGSVGSGDVDDIMKAVTYLKNQYHISNIYLSGNSYGGYMSIKALVDYPDTFKGIFSINGVTDWESLLVKMKTSIFNTPFKGLPKDENKNLYEQASIINKIKNLDNQRIEIIQGESDNTIPLWQANLLNNKLKDANKNVNLVTYKGEDHVFIEKKNIDDLCTRMFGLIDITPDKECIN